MAGAQASITRTSPHFWGGGVSQAKSDQQMQFPCVPQLSEMKMILCGSEQSDGDSMGRSRERQKKREKKTRVRPESGTSSKTQAS